MDLLRRIEGRKFKGSSSVTRCQRTSDTELWSESRHRDVYFRTGEFVDEYEHARHEELPDNVEVCSRGGFQECSKMEDSLSAEMLSA